MSAIKPIFQKLRPNSFNSFLATSLTNSFGVKTRELDAVQAQYLSEQCIAVNENDESTGSISKEECHRNPILHRAFSVFLFNSNRQLLLQKRSPTKITFPEVWTNTCCSHPLFNDLEMEKDRHLGVRRAALRKLKHELGITSLKLDQLHVMGRFLYKAQSDANWVEHELDYAVVIKGLDLDSISANPEEVSDTRFVDECSMNNMLEEKSKYNFSPWFELFTKFKWLQLWWQNLDRIEDMKEDQKIHRLN